MRNKFNTDTETEKTPAVAVTSKNGKPIASKNHKHAPTEPMAHRQLTFDERAALAEKIAKVAQQYGPVVLQEVFPKGVPPEVELFILPQTSTLPANAFTLVQVLVTYAL